MSNQSIDCFLGSQPFITGKQYQNLSLAELKHILEEEKESLKTNYKELHEKQKLIRDIKKLKKLNKKVKQGIDIKKERKKTKSKSKPKKIAPVKTTGPSKNKKIKTFDEYFQECIENKEFPADTPPYFREALERAIKEYHQGLVKEKSALKILLISILLKEILILLQLNILIKFMQL